MKTKLKIGEKAIISLPISVKAIDKEKYTLTMVASTGDVDRHGDTVQQAGWDLTQFKKNPVILNSHRYNDATEVIAKAIRTEVVGKGKRAKLEQDWQFAVDENPKAKIIFDLYAGGFLHASSVGFIPTKFAEDKQGNRDWFVIEEAELLEVSAVSVPANAYALAKQKGLNMDDEDGNPIVDVEEEEEENNTDETDDETETEVEEEEDTETPTVPIPTIEDDVTPEVTATPETPEVETPAPKAVSANAVLLKAINNIRTAELEQLHRANKIIQKLLNEKPNVTPEVQQKIRIRLVNKAIRSLIKAK